MSHQPQTDLNSNPDPPMRPPSPTRASTLLTSLTSILTHISTATPHTRHSPVRLVAVSKLKPATDILALHNPPPGSPGADASLRQLHFGENYLQELLEKSLLLPAEIRWHFIGALQSNKCVSLARDVTGLWCVESVDTRKKAGLLNKGREERATQNQDEEKLRVFVQVNTSGEDSKSGVEPSEAVDLCRYIRDQCPRLRLQGLMTIGAMARSKATGEGAENEDFITLKETRDRVAKELGMSTTDEGEEGKLELSMGMSEDFEGAVRMGSDEVRVGSTIFGERPPKGEARVLPTEDEKQDT